MTRPARLAPVLVLALAGVLASLDANAALTEVRALPVAPDAAKDATVPSKIMAKEKVEGLSLDKNKDSGTTVVTIAVPTQTGACLALLPASGQSGAATDRIFEYQGSGVLRVRDDRLVEKSAGGAVELEERVVAVDAATLGATVLATRHVPLAVIARGPADLVAYGAQVKEGVLVIVKGGTRASFRDERGLNTNTCGLQRFLLPTADPASAADPKTVTAASVAAAAGADAAKVPFARAVHLATMVSIDQKPEKGLFGIPSPAAPAQATRIVSVAVSLSRSSRDPEPILSVTMGLPAEATGLNTAMPQMNDFVE